MYFIFACTHCGATRDYGNAPLIELTARRALLLCEDKQCGRLNGVAGHTLHTFTQQSPTITSPRTPRAKLNAYY